MGLEVDSYLEQIVDAVFSNASLTECGSITCDSLKEVLRSRPTLINELSLLKSLSSTRGANNKPGDSTNIGEQSSNTSQFHHNAMSGWDCLVTWLGKRFPLCNKLRTEYICNNLKNKNIKDVRKVKELLEQDEESFKKTIHPHQAYGQPYHPYSKEGIAHERNLLSPDYFMDWYHPLEKAQYPYYFAKREQMKKEYINLWKKKMMKPGEGEDKQCS